HTRSTRDWSSDVCSSDLGDGDFLAWGGLPPDRNFHVPLEDHVVTEDLRQRHVGTTAWGRKGQEKRGKKPAVHGRAFPKRAQEIRSEERRVGKGGRRGGRP